MLYLTRTVDAQIAVGRAVEFHDQAALLKTLLGPPVIIDA